MPQLVPIDSIWISRFAKLANGYGETARLRIQFLPKTPLMPEDLVNELVIDVELMLICLRAGAWLNGASWHPYVRYAIAKRLKARADRLFRGEVLNHKQAILAYQLRGGLLAERDKLRNLAYSLRGPKSTLYDRAIAQLISTLTDPIEENTLIQPFHWIRVAIAATEKPLIGMNLYSSENHKQKQVLAEMLRATV